VVARVVKVRAVKPNTFSIVTAARSIKSQIVNQLTDTSRRRRTTMGITGQTTVDDVSTELASCHPSDD
jgi:hypothetical protein